MVEHGLRGSSEGGRTKHVAVVQARDHARWPPGEAGEVGRCNLLQKQFKAEQSDMLMNFMWEFKKMAKLRLSPSVGDICLGRRIRSSVLDMLY